jgi:hypothetical protein
MARQNNKYEVTTTTGKKFTVQASNYSQAADRAYLEKNACSIRRVYADGSRGKRRGLN